MNSSKVRITGGKNWGRSLISSLYLDGNTPSMKLVENTCEYCEIFKISFFYRIPLLAASEMNYSPNQDRYYHPHALQIHSLFLHHGIIELISSERFAKYRQNLIKNKIPLIHNHNLNEMKLSFHFMQGPNYSDVHMIV